MALLKKTTAQKLLDVSKTSLEKLVAVDPTFPRPIKMGAKVPQGQPDVRGDVVSGVSRQGR